MRPPVIEADGIRIGPRMGEGGYPIDIEFEGGRLSIPRGHFAVTEIHDRMAVFEVAAHYDPLLDYTYAIESDEWR